MGRLTSKKSGTRKNRVAGAALGILTLLLAACGGDDGDTTETDSGAPGGDATVNVGDGGDLGDILVDSDGNTLYLVDEESGDNLMCTDDACLEAWPPLTVESGEPSAGDGVDGTLSTVTRDDGTVQVTYDGAPLYTYVNDSGPGDITGHGVSDPITWLVVTPDGPAALDAGEDGG